MKIAFFHNLPSGGAKRALYEWTRRLSISHSIDVYTLSTADHDFCDIRPFVQNYHVHDFVPLSSFRTPFGRLNQVQRWRDLGELEKLNQQIASQINVGGYDVVFVHTCMYSFIPALLRYIEIPSVYYLHEPFGAGFYRTFERPYISKSKRRELVDRFDPFIWLYQHRLRLLQERSVRKTKLLLSNSQFTRECIRSEFGVDAPFSPYGVNMDGFQPVPGSARENFVVSVGEMSPRKGFDFVVESLGKIPATQRPPLKLACNTINKDELEYIKNLAEQNGVNIEILTNLGVAELRLLYTKAQLCVYAPVREPFGLVPLEAMACGTPVIGVHEGGVPESVVDQYTGLVVERDSSKFGAAVQYMLENKSLIDSYGCNGREHVIQNWSWEKSVSILTSHLEMCAGGTR